MAGGLADDCFGDVEGDGVPAEEEVSSPLEEGGDSAWDSEDFEGSMPDCVSSCGEVACEGSVSSTGRERLLRSSSGSAITAIRVPTLIPFDPCGCYIWIMSIPYVASTWRDLLTIILAILPSSWASTSI